MRTRIKTLGFSLLLPAIVPLAVHAQNHSTSPVSSQAAHSQNFQFEQLTIAHGLPNSTVNCILQDSQGFLWFGTRDGLARYDGYGFKVYRHDLTDSTTISNNFIHRIFEDRQRNLWIGTYFGLNKFNRYSETFTRYTQPPEETVAGRAHEVLAIYEDQFGLLWIGYWAGPPHGGLYQFNRETGEFTPYRHDPNNKNSLSGNAVRFIIEDDGGNLWIGTEESGLNRLTLEGADRNTPTFKHYQHDPQDPHSLGSNKVWYALKDRNGALWFATFDGGLNKYDPVLDGFIRYRRDPANPTSLHQDQVYALYQDSHGSIWVSNGVLSRLDPATGSFSHFRFSPSQNSRISNYLPFTIHEDRAGNLWVGTSGAGVFKIDLKPHKFTHYRHETEDANSLPVNDIRLLFEDSADRIWIAARESGLTLFDQGAGRMRHFRHDAHDPHSLSDNIIYSIYEDRSQTIWIGTKEGLDRFKAVKGNFTRYQTETARQYSAYGHVVISIYEDRHGHFWVGMASGLYHFDRRNGHFRNFRPDTAASESLPDNYIRGVLEDSQGNIWVSTFWRTYLFDRQTHRFTLVKPVFESTTGWAKDLFEDQQGKIWGRHYGLFKLQVDKLQFTRYRMIPQPGNELSFDAVYNRIEQTYLDETGNIWCATRYGLHKFDPQGEQFIAHYYEKDGLASNNVLKILSDHQGRLWLLTAGGLSIFDENALPGAQFTNLGRDDGVINSASAPEAFIRTRNGDIYWGGTNGIYRFYPEVKATNPHLPKIQLTGFKKFNQPVKLDSSISIIRTLRLSHDENFFSLAFAAMDFTNPKQNHYAYKLEGLDHDWIQAGNKHEADYTHVPPGEYTFRVKGANNDGLWNEEGASVQIIIAPPFWQTWWFRLVAALTLIAVLAALYNYRVSKLLEIERTRLRIARDLHDDVGSSLSSIALTAEMLQKELATNGLVNRQLARVHETAQKLARNLKEIVWAIDPHRDKFGDLLLHIKEAADELLGQKGIAYALEVPQDTLPQSLKMEFRRNLFLIYKEMLHNVVKHAEATKVEITLTRTNGMLQLQVADNGKGFGKEKSENGSGLKSMHARAGELNGKLEIDSQPERGTTVMLTVKIA